MNKESLRIVLKRKLRKLIRETELLLSSRKSYTLSEASEISERTLEKIKLQLKLNSLMLEDAKSDEERKELEEEGKELQAALTAELMNGLEVLNSLIESFRRGGMEDRAEELEILRDVRESELLELTGEKA